MSVPRLVLVVGVLAALTPARARAVIAPQAKVIVDRYVEASGGAAALAKQVALHTKGRINTMEFKGSFEQWSQTPDRLVSPIVGLRPTSA